MNIEFKGTENIDSESVKYTRNVAMWFFNNHEVNFRNDDKCVIEFIEEIGYSGEYAFGDNPNSDISLNVSCIKNHYDLGHILIHELLHSHMFNEDNLINLIERYKEEIDSYMNENEFEVTCIGFNWVYYLYENNGNYSESEWIQEIICEFESWQLLAQYEKYFKK